MNRGRLGVALAITGLLFSAAGAAADVKTQEKTQVKFEGMLGRVMGLFGGKAAKEGLVNTVIVKGDRKATFGDSAGEIIDLAEEKVYEVNLKDKSYKVVTFAEIRRKLQEAARKAEEDARKMEDRDKKDPDQKEMTIDFDVKNTGQKKSVNGFDCRQMIMTIAVHEKGKTLEQAGGMVMTVDSWMAPRIDAVKEIAEFDLRYARKLSEDLTLTAGQGLLQAMAMYPGLKQAMAKFQAERVNLDGTPVQSITTMHTVMTPEQAQQAKREDADRPAGPGGVVGGMLGRFGRKKAEEPKEQPAAAAPAGPNRTLFMTSTSDVLSVSTAVSAQDVAVPAGFKQK